MEQERVNLNQFGQEVIILDDKINYIQEILIFKQRMQQDIVSGYQISRLQGLIPNKEWKRVALDSLTKSIRERNRILNAYGKRRKNAFSKIQSLYEISGSATMIMLLQEEICHLRAIRAVQERMNSGEWNCEDIDFKISLIQKILRYMEGKQQLVYSESEIDLLKDFDFDEEWKFLALEYLIQDITNRWFLLKRK